MMVPLPNSREGWREVGEEEGVIHWETPKSYHKTQHN